MRARTAPQSSRTDKSDQSMAGLPASGDRGSVNVIIVTGEVQPVTSRSSNLDRAWRACPDVETPCNTTSTAPARLSHRSAVWTSHVFEDVFLTMGVVANTTIGGLPPGEAYGSGQRRSYSMLALT